MTRNELLLSPEYWITKFRISLFNCAEKYMKKETINRKQLAEKLGVSKGYVTQVLNGDYDHRLSKLVELSLSFGYVPEIEFVPIDQIIDYDTKIDGERQFCHIYDNVGKIQIPLKESGERVPAPKSNTSYNHLKLVA